MELSSQGNICTLLKPNFIVVIVSGDVTHVTYLKPLLLIEPKREQYLIKQVYHFSFRCVYLTYLKNPYRFQDDFWSRFIGIWTLIWSLLASSADLFLSSPGMHLPYCMCTGEKLSTSLGIVSPLPKITTIFPLLTIFSVVIRMKLYKRNTVLSIDSSVVGDRERQKLSNIFIVFGLLVLIAVDTFVSSNLGKLGIHELNKPPFCYLSYYRSLVHFPLIFLWFFFALLCNKDYIQTILEEVSEMKKLK